MGGDDLTVQQILAELELHQKARDMGCPTFVSPERIRKALGLPEPESPEFGPSPFRAVYPVWQLREMLLKSHGALFGRFTCADLGDPKLNPPDDDVDTPVIVEANPPR